MAYEDPNIQNAADIGDTYSALQPDAAASAAFPGTGLAIGAGLGLLSSIGKQNAAAAQARAAAMQTRFSPWTKLGLGKMPEAPNALGSLLGYGASGATLQQGLENGKLNPWGIVKQPGATIMAPEAST